MMPNDLSYPVEALHVAYQRGKADALASPELREALAKLCHDQWSGWMQYLFSKIYPCGHGRYVMRQTEAERWTRQMDTPYADLSEAEKDSDRKEADRFLELLKVFGK